MTPFQKFIVSSYRYFAAAILIAILSTGIGYALITVFYAGNSSWAAPILISQTHERILALQAELFRSQQAANTLEVAIAGLNAESAVLKESEVSSSALLAKARSARDEQVMADSGSTVQLAPLGKAKAADVTRTNEIVASLAKQEATINTELAAGLITKEDAASQRAAINAVRVSATESAVARVALDRQISDLQRSKDTLTGGRGSSAHALEMLSRIDQLQNQVAQTRLKLEANQLEITSKTAELAKLKSIVATLFDSPYYRVITAKQPLSFAFVPYSNESHVKVGQSIYDCALQVVWCKKVGVVKHLHHDEEHAQHPLFHVEARGTLVEMELTDSSAAKSRVVFLGGAPLFL